VRKGGDDFIFMDFNKTGEKIYHVQKNELIGKSVLETFPGIKDFGLFEVFQRVWRTGQPEHYPISMYKDERIAGWRDNFVYKLPSGEVVAIYSDETESKQKEEALRESEEKFKLMFDNAPISYQSLDKNGCILEVNKAWLDSLGYQRDEVIGEWFGEFLHHDQKEIFRKLFPVNIQSHEPIYGVEFTLKRKDGSYIIVEYTARIGRDAEGGFVRTHCIFLDITERKRAEKALRESEAFKNTIIESSPDCIKLLDLEGNLKYMSKGGQEKLEIKDIKVYLNKSWIDFWQGKDSINARMAVDTAVKGATGKFRGYSPTETGIPRWWDVIITPLWGSNGEVEQLLAVSRDITEQKQMEEELLRAQKLESVGILAGGIAHDFNNILTIIMGNISLARTDLAQGDDPSELLTEAERASKRAQTLTKQLLTFAKGGAPVKETASIKDILKESCSFVLRGSKARSELSIAIDLWPAEVDVGQISQVINNIVINANQAMPKGGIIQVAADNLVIEDRIGLPVNPGRYIRISITDQGIGIAKDQFLNIFDPYFTTKQEGSGLGLATTYSIIKKHDGHITVESKLGEGTTFHIYLPASDKAVPEKEEIKLIKGHGRILVMDDEVALKKMIGRMLQKLGYESEFAKDGAEAIEIYKAAMESGMPYDAVILDLTIPGGMGGKEAIKKLLEIDPEVKAVVSSGYSDDPVLANFQEYGFKGMMPKPYESLSLGKVLHEVLEGDKLNIED
jgi:two-component system cell cycle sensor histidine kinase/response regulator CckA